MHFGMGFWRGLGVAGVVLYGCVVGAVAVTAVPGVAYAQSRSMIDVQGNRRVEADTIRSYFKPGPGGRLDAAQTDEALKALYSTGLFEDVKITPAGSGRVLVTVVENPVINRVAYEGNHKLKDDQLSGELQSKARGTLSRANVQADTQRIVDIYRRLGRYDVSVDPKIIQLPNERVDLVFEIKEGAKTGVKHIEFVGNNAISSYRLKEVIKTAQSGLLSFLQNNDVYDPDRVEADRDLLRRFYLTRGFVDVRVASAVAQFDPSEKGFTVTYTIEEGEQYRVGSLEVQSNVPAVDPGNLRPMVKVSAGDIFNSEAVEKSVEEMTIEAARRGYAFATLRVRPDRHNETRTINLAFVVEEGPRFYIERINVRGNSRTRDYVIRREFDLAEGDAYNKALINRAERRLKNLNFFKSVKITDEPGSAPDRVIVNVDVEEMSTGEFSVSGGYSTAQGLVGEVSVAERNLLGRGQYAKIGGTFGQYSQGVDFSFVEPYLLGYRIALGLDLFYKATSASSYQSYDSTTIGGNIRFGFQLREDLNLQLRYSAYQQKVTLPYYLNNCTYAFVPFPADGSAGCYADGEASLPVRVELSRGATLTSLVGYTLTYNSLDNNRLPTSGWVAEIRQDYAGVGGDVNYVRTSTDVRKYQEVMPDVVAMLHIQAGNITGVGNNGVRMLDHFQLGPTLVRGFAVNGFGPRDLTPGTTNDSLGGTDYWGASLELQTPLYFAPKDFGIKLAAFADAGWIGNYRGPTSNPSVTPEVLTPGVTLGDSNLVRTSVGVGLLWDSPFGPLRLDYAIPLTQEFYDRTQQFRFGGGTKF